MADAKDARNEQRKRLSTILVGEGFAVQSALLVILDSGSELTNVFVGLMGMGVSFACFSWAIMVLTDLED